MIMREFDKRKISHFSLWDIIVPNRCERYPPSLKEATVLIRLKLGTKDKINVRAFTDGLICCPSSTEFQWLPQCPILICNRAAGHHYYPSKCSHKLSSERNSHTRIINYCPGEVKRNSEGVFHSAQPKNRTCSLCYVLH